MSYVSKTLVLGVVVATFSALGLPVDTGPQALSAPTNLRVFRPSSGCGLTGRQTGDFHLTTTDGRGVSRDYEVIVPATYNPSTAVALSFVYHGAGGTQNQSKSFGLQGAPGAGTSSIFVFPQGVDYAPYGVGWNDSTSGYDVVFFDRMLASLEDNYCVDPGRVFVAGFSWGCDQATALICARGDRIRAAGLASCTDEFADPTNYRTYQSCPVTNSAAIRFTHDASGGDSGYPSPLFTTTSALFRSFNSCSSTSTPIAPSPCNSFNACANPFLECPYVGLDHNLPSNWAAETWTFFSSFR